MKGCPEKTFILPELHPYFTHLSDRSYHEGLLLKDQRIIVPNALRSKMKSILHQGDLEIENCIKESPSSIMLATYKQRVRRRQPSETPVNPEIPDHSWTKLPGAVFSFTRSLLFVNC